MTSHAENRITGITSRVLLLPALCLMLLLGGCASTSLINQWKNPTVTPRPFQKFLVVGIANDITLRRAYENLLTEDLQKLGVNAVRSIDYLPKDRKPTKEQVRAMVKECGADAVITTRVAGTRNGMVFIDGSRFLSYGVGSFASSDPNSDFFMFFAGAFSAPDAQDLQTAVLETRLFDAENATLVWVATTSSFDSDQQFRTIRNLARLIATTLRREGFLNPEP